MLPHTPVPVAPLLPRLDAVSARPLAVRLTPLAGDEVAGWCALLGRLPAVEAVEAVAFTAADGTADFAVHVRSAARLQVQLRHLAERLQARFTPGADGVLCLALWPAHSTAGVWDRVTQYRTTFGS